MGMQFGPYGAAIGAVLGGVLGGILYKPIEPPKLSQAKLDSVTQGQTDFEQQGKHLGEVGDLIQKANNLSNTRYKEDLGKFAPNLESTTGRIGETGAALAGGNLPAGFLSGGPGGKQLTAADLGLTSDSLKKTGSDVVGAGLTEAGKLNPFNATSTGTLINPGALLQRKDAANYYNTGLKNQAILGKSVADAINPFASGMATGVGSMGSSLRDLYTSTIGKPDPRGYGFGSGDTGPTADSQFDSSGNFTGGNDWGYGFGEGDTGPTADINFDAGGDFGGGEFGGG
jgi:hypothetical protein